MVALKALFKPSITALVKPHFQCARIRKARDVGEHGVSFREMQVAAGRVDPQIPAQIGNLLAGGKAKGQFKNKPSGSRVRGRGATAAQNKAAAGGVSSRPVSANRTSGAPAKRRNGLG